MDHELNNAADETPENAERSGVSRRQFLKMAGLAGAAVSVGGGLGGLLFTWSRQISIVIGVLTILLGLLFAGAFRFGHGTWRMGGGVAPAVGLAAAPLLGIVFGLGWTPCIGPTLSVVLTLALNEGTALRGAVLALAYALGLGVPFLVAGLAFDRFAGTMEWVRLHQGLLQKLGGGVMVAVGVLLVTGLWDHLMGIVRQWVSAYGVLI